MIKKLYNYPGVLSESTIQLTEEQEKNCLVVYKLDEEKKGYAFHSLFNESVNYDDGEYIAIPFKSTGAYRIEWAGGRIFANVIGSTDDHNNIPGYNGSWLQLLNSLEAYSAHCCTDGKKYTANNPYGEQIHAEGREITGLVGGHVILAQAPNRVGRNGEVYLFCICRAHNAQGNFYMKIRHGGAYGLRLTGYLRAENIEPYLD